MVENLTEMEMDAISEVGNIVMGAASNVLTTLTGKTVQIVAPEVSMVSIDKIKKNYPMPCVVVDVRYVSGFKGSNVFIFKEIDIAVINNLMNNVPPDDNLLPLDNIKEGTAGEAINKMMSYAVTAMSEMFNRAIVINPPSIKQVDPTQEALFGPWMNEEDKVVQISFSLKIDEWVDSTLVQIVPAPLAKSMVNILLSVDEEVPDMEEEFEAAEPQEIEATETDISSEETLEEDAQIGMDMSQDEVIEVETDVDIPREESIDVEAKEILQEEVIEVEAEADILQEESTDVEAKDILQEEKSGPIIADMQEEEIPAIKAGVENEEKSAMNKEFEGSDQSSGDMSEIEEANRILWSQEKEEESAEGGSLSFQERMHKLDLIRDIPIELTVIIGENNLLLGELLSAGKGSVVPLKRYAREPVDIMVNDQLVARGEVVIVDGKIGVKVTSIESKLPHITKLQA